MALIDRDGDFTAVVYNALGRRAGHTGTSAELEAAGRRLVDGITKPPAAKGKAGRPLLMALRTPRM
jgi:YD repeat-containing protein